MQHFLKKFAIIAISLVLCMESKAAFSRGNTSSKEATPALLTVGILRNESERSYKLSLQLTLGIFNAQTRLERDRSNTAILNMRQKLMALDKSDKTSRAFLRVNNALSGQIDALPKLTANNAGSLYDVNEDLLNKLNSLSFAMEAETSDTSSRIVALALRQATLAQRMAKIVLLRSLNKTMAAKQGLQVDLVQSKNEFENGMQLLLDETRFDPKLRDRLELARQQWVFYESALTTPDANHVALRNITTTSDRIAEQMIEIVHLSYALPIDGLQSASWQ